jgi:hypothetical protein
MAVVPAWDFPGASGDFATLPNPSGVLGHFRTDSGYSAWTVAVIMNVDDVNQADRGVLWVSRRASNDQRNHGVSFDPTNNNYEYQYNASAVHEAALTEVNGTWIVSALSYAGGTGNVTLRRIPLSTATQSHSSTGAGGGTAFSDAQTQSITLGGNYDGTAPLDGQIAMVLIIKGTELSQANLEAWAADPLNYGDTLIATYGANCFFWDDSGTDVGDNNAGAPTLAGSTTRNSSAGPDVTAREEPSPDNSPVISSVGDFGIIFNGEQRVIVTGSNFGTTTGILGITADALGGSQVEQDVNSWSATEISFNCALGALTPGQRYLFVTNQTIGTDFGQDGSILISVLADPGVETIGLRQSPSPVNLVASTPVSKDMGALLYKRDAQEELTYSASGLPTGATINSASGVITGIPSAAATYSPSVTVTDGNGDTAVQAFSWVVSPLAVDPPDPEDPEAPSIPPPNSGSSRRATRRSF